MRLTSKLTDTYSSAICTDQEVSLCGSVLNIGLEVLGLRLTYVVSPQIPCY